jgi:hypothetical protein
VGAETDAARAEVLASRAALLEEVQRLEASARSAVDIPAKIKRQPAKAAGIAAGTAFIALGGPQRLYRRGRRAIRGPEAEMPKSLLPKEIEKTVRKLGTDGDKVRATLEREFVQYLDERSKVRRQSTVSALAMMLARNILKPVSAQAGKRLATELFAPDSEGFESGITKAKTRYEAARATGEGADRATEPAAPAPRAPATGAPATKASTPSTKR